MKTTLLTTLAAAALCQAGSTCNAGPAQRADFPADPAWVLHLDVDAVRPTLVGKFLMEQLQKPDAENKLASFKLLFHFDPRTALHGLSLYSATQKPEDGVMILYGDFDNERLETLAKSARDSQSSKHGSYTIYNWIDEKRKAKKDGEKPRTYGAIAGKRVVFGQKEESVAAALDVIAGGANLSSTQLFQQFGAPAEGKFLQVAAHNIKPRGDNPNAALLKLSDEVRLELGESQGQINGLITLQARDQEVAGQLNSVAQGILALMKLNTEKPAQARFADSVALKQDGKEVVATMSLPAQEVLQGLHKLAAKKAGRDS